MTLELMTPGWTVICWLGRSMLRMRFMRARLMTTRAFGGERAAAEAGAGAAGDEGDVVFGADADDGLNLRRWCAEGRLRRA